MRVTRGILGVLFREVGYGGARWFADAGVVSAIACHAGRSGRSGLLAVAALPLGVGTAGNLSDGQAHRYTTRVVSTLRGRTGTLGTGWKRSGPSLRMCATEEAGLQGTAGGLTRREALKRGAIVAGSLWAVPVVQAVGMRPAYAQTTSAAWTNCVAYCIKWETDVNDVVGVASGCGFGADTWSNNWTSLGGGSGNRLTCPEGAADALPPKALLDQIQVIGDPNEGFCVQLPSTCRLYGQDPSPDEFSPHGAAAKCGRDGETLVDGTGSDFGDLVEIAVCGNGKSISHIELIIQCCDLVG